MLQGNFPEVGVFWILYWNTKPSGALTSKTYRNRKLLLKQVELLLTRPEVPVKVVEFTPRVWAKAELE